jgi:phosphate-selective porin OprO/OprP
MNRTQHTFAALAFTAISALTVTPDAQGGTASAAASKAAVEPAKTDTSVFDDIWKLATLYKNDQNPFLQELKLRGRYHGQYHWLDSDQGNDNGWEDRRSRFGIDAKLFDKKIELRIDAQSSDGFDPFYNGLVDAYIKWKPSDAFSLTLGRQKPQIGYYDFLQSTNAQPTFERSAIFNNLRVDRAVGAVAEGKLGKWSWQAGAYSNDIDKEFGGFDGGVSFGAGIGYDFKEALGLDKAEWRFDYLHSDIEPADLVLSKYEDLFSTTFWVKEGRWSGVAEAFYGAGAAPDIFGFFLQPTYDLIPKKLQLVARYTFATGDGADSVTAQSRYERTAPDITGSGRGETYHAAYVGAQYFIYGDKLKVLAGAEYADLDGGGNGGDFNGWTFLTGVRLGF